MMLLVIYWKGCNILLIKIVVGHLKLNCGERIRNLVVHASSITDLYASVVPHTTEIATETMNRLKTDIIGRRGCHYPSMNIFWWLYWLTFREVSGPGGPRTASWRGVWSISSASRADAAASSSRGRAMFWNLSPSLMHTLVQLTLFWNTWTWFIQEFHGETTRNEAKLSYFSYSMYVHQMGIFCRPWIMVQTGH
jgi:hypothetical protein